MRKIICIAIAIFLFAGCRKEDFNEVSFEAASAKKGIPVLSEVWTNGQLQQKNFYENGRLVKISFPSDQFPREYQYSYRDKDHYTVMTGDYMYYHYYFNDEHQLVRMDVSDENNCGNQLWVRHEFIWEKDRIKTHSWMMGNFPAGSYSGTEERYEYKNPWEALIKEYWVTYTNWVRGEEVLVATHSYHWKSPFEYRFLTGANSYTSYNYSTTVKMPSYNTVGFPWGYYSLENANKHELMNLLATTWNASVSQGNWRSAAMSGMLLIETRTMSGGQLTVNSKLQNIVVNKDKLPISYDIYYYKQDGTPPNVGHYEYKYVVL
jgi:hypothetical protein